MQKKIDTIHHLLEAISEMKEEIINSFNQSIDLFITEGDDHTDEESTCIKLAFETDIKHVIALKTIVVNEPSVCAVAVNIDETRIGSFCFEDGDFNKEGEIIPEVQSFIMKFITTEIITRKVSEIIDPLLRSGNIYSTHHTVDSVEKAIKHFGLDLIVVDGTMATTMNIVRKDPYDVLGSASLTVTVPSTYTTATTNITLVELAKSVLIGLFIRKELTVVDGQ